MRIKVLRRKDQINQKPTAAEIESSRNAALETTPTQQAERELEDQIPKHLPIKIKIKADKENAFKNLQNEDWHRDLELEIRNTGDKPIYYIDLLMVFPDVLDSAGNKTGYPIRYGRAELINFDAPLRSDDSPLLPGDTFIFKLSESNAKGWEHFRQRYNKPNPKKVSIHFRALSFGDGTGFMWSDGAPILKKIESIEPGFRSAAQSY